MEIYKEDLARQYAEKYDTSIKAGREAIKNVTELITENLGNGNDVLLKDFFYFKVKERKAKGGIDLVTRERTEIPAVKTVVAKMTSHLKNTIQGKTN